MNLDFFDENDEFYRVPKKQGCILWLIVLSVLFVVIMLCLLSSCTTTRTSRNNYQYDGNVNVVTQRIHDTTYIDRQVTEYVHDTTYVERENKTDIVFIDGGGNYNILTGEISGVQTLTISEREKALQAQILIHQERENELLTKNILLTDSISSMQIISESEAQSESRSLWWLWLLIGCCVGAGTIIALKKIPITKSLMFWL